MCSFLRERNYNNYHWAKLLKNNVTVYKILKKITIFEKYKCSLDCSTIFNISNLLAHYIGTCKSQAFLSSFVFWDKYTTWKYFQVPS